MKHELIVIWDTGEKTTAVYRTLEEAEEHEAGFHTAFGNQIAWTGINAVEDGEAPLGDWEKDPCDGDRYSWEENEDEMFPPTDDNGDWDEDFQPITDNFDPRYDTDEWQ